MTNKSRLTNDFGVETARNFRSSISASPGSIHYLMASKCTPFTDDYDPDEPQNSVFESYYDVFSQMLFGKLVTASDVASMIKTSMWEDGKTFDMYDDKDVNLKDKNFYAISNENDNQYSLFKCLFNGKIQRGTEIYIPPVHDKPLSQETSFDDEYYRTADGYLWKLMCVIPKIVFDKFSNEDSFPIIENQAVVDSAVNGAIHHVQIENPGSNYNSYAFGSVKESRVAGNPKIIAIQTDTSLDILTFDVNVTSGTFTEFISGTTVKKIFFKNSLNQIWTFNSKAVSGKLYFKNSSIIKVLLDSSVSMPGNIVTMYQTTNNTSVGTISAQGTISSSRRDLIPDLSSNTDFYSFSSFYIRSGKGAGQLRTIAEYIVTGNERRVLIDDPFVTEPDSSSRFEIGPRVVITGDGVATNGIGEAKAIVNMDEASNTIYSIEMIDVGKDYSWAEARIYANTGYIDLVTGDTVSASNAECRPIISPPGGHGSDINSEMFSNRVCISTMINSGTDPKIPTQNDYRQISLLKNPEFSDFVVTLDDSALLWVAGEKVKQNSDGSIAYVSGRQGNNLTLTRANGIFKSGNTISSQRGSGNITQSINSINKTFNALDQKINLAMTVTNMGPAGTGFILDEPLYQDSSEATGILYSKSANILSVSNSRGVWNSSDVISGLVARVIGVTSGAVAEVQGISLQDVKPYTGKILTVENMSPITRSETSSERLKIILEF